MARVEGLVVEVEGIVWRELRRKVGTGFQLLRYEGHGAIEDAVVESCSSLLGFGESPDAARDAGGEGQGRGADTASPLGGLGLDEGGDAHLHLDRVRRRGRHGIAERAGLGSEIVLVLAPQGLAVDPRGRAALA